MSISRVANFINRSPRTQKILRAINDNTSVFSAGASFLIASGLRPAMIGMFNFKDNKDKKTSQASAIATGLVELALTVGVFIPLNKSIKGASKILYDKEGSTYYHNKEILRQFKSLTNRCAKLLLLPAISYTRFALIKPLVDTLSKKKEEKLNKWA